MGFRSKLVFVGLILAVCLADSQAQGVIPGGRDRYPTPRANQKMFIIPFHDVEGEWGVAIGVEIGRMMTASPCGASLSGYRVESISNNGFPYYVVSLASSEYLQGPNVGCLEPDSSRFVSIEARPSGYPTLPTFLNANHSSDGTIVYAPRSLEVRYQIWRPGDLMNAIEI